MRAHPRLHSLAPSMASGCSRGCDGGHHCSRFPRCSQWLHHQPEEVHHLLHVGSVLHHPWRRATQRTPTPAHTRRQWVVSTGRESQCSGLGWWEKKSKNCHIWVLKIRPQVDKVVCSLLSSCSPSDNDLSWLSACVLFAAGKWKAEAEISVVWFS